MWDTIKNAEEYLFPILFKEELHWKELQTIEDFIENHKDEVIATCLDNKQKNGTGVFTHKNVDIFAHTDGKIKDEQTQPVCTIVIIRDFETIQAPKLNNSRFETIQAPKLKRM